MKSKWKGNWDRLQVVATLEYMSTSESPKSYPKKQRNKKWKAQQKKPGKKAKTQYKN